MIDDVIRARLVVASLVAALLASPVILDACLFTCHTSTSAQADEDGGAPSCHHATEEREVRLERSPASCGHDHSPAPLTMTAKERGADGRVDVACLVVASPSAQHPASIEVGAARAAIPDTRS